MTAKCMSRSGFEYPPYAVSQPAIGTTGTIGGFGIPLTVQQAQRHGYEGRISRQTDTEIDAEASYVATLSQSRQALYRDTLDDSRSPRVLLRLPPRLEFSAFSRGCIAEGRIAVFGSVLNFLRLFYYPQQVTQFGDDALRDSGTIAAMSRYSDCMRAAGVDVKSPSKAIRLAERMFGSAAAGASPSDAERVMAVTDATCQSTSRVYETLEESVLRAASTWLNDHEDEILALAEIQKNVARPRAERTLQGSDRAHLSSR